MKEKILSFVLVFCLVITLIPATVATTHAATTPPNVNKATVLDRINELEKSLSGTFFTTDGNRASSSSDDRCNVVNVLNQNSTVRNLIYSNKGQTGYRPDADSYLPGHYAHDYGNVSTLGWSCFGFANFAEWYIFSDKCSDSVSTKTIAKGISYNYSNMSAKAKPGDVVRLTGNGFSGHSGIVKSVNANYVTILDANGDAGEYYGTSRITTRNVYYASGMNVSISRATNSVVGWPTVIASNVASSGKIKLSWYKHPKAAKYKVYRATSKNGTYKFMKTTTSTTYTNTSATPSKMYYYKVKAVSSAGKFLAWSNVVKRTCDLARPTITSASKVASTGNIKVIWKDVKNANRYEVYRSTDNSNYTKIATYDTKMNTGKNHTCINSKNIVAGTKYYYKIKAINTNNSGANSALSLAVSCVAGSSTAVSSTGNADAMVSAAESCVGKSRSGLGLTGEWCARFVYYCANKSGNASKIGNNVYVGTLAEQTVNDKGGTIVFVNQSAYNACKDRFNSSRCVYDPNYIPEKGDLYIQKGEDLGDQYFAHIGIVRKNSTESHIAYTIEGNTTCSDGNHTDYEYVEYKTRNNNTMSEPYGFSAFVKPVYVTSGWPVLKATNVESTGKIKLSWYKHPKAAKYKVYRATSKNGTYKFMKTTTSTTYTNTSATPSKMYYYKVKAVSSAGKFLAWSDVVNRTCDLARPTITYIGNQSATGNVVVKWKDVKNANRYEVYRATSDGNYSKIATFNTKMNTGKTYSCINSKNITPGVKYYYKIKAINTNNTGADSALSTAWARTADLAQPVVTLSNNEKTGKVVVSWKDVEGADSYKIYIATSKNGTYKLNATWNSPNNTGETHVVPHNSGVAGTTYYYKITACMSSNEDATSAYSKYVYRTCDLAQPEVTLSYSSTGKIVVSWAKITGADRYEIYRSTSPKTGFERIYSGTSISVTNTKNLVSGTTYYYKVRAIDKDKSAANSAYSEVKYMIYN